MSTDHRAPCTAGDVCGEPSACPPEFPSDAQGPAAPDRSDPVTAPEDDGPVGEVPPTGFDAHYLRGGLTEAVWYADGIPTKQRPDPYQALLTQLHEVKTREAALRAGIENILSETDAWRPYESRDTGSVYLSEAVDDLRADLRALLDGEVRP